MSGGLFTAAPLRETGRAVTQEQIEELQRHHAQAYARQLSTVRPLPGARELLDSLTRAGVQWAIATSGRGEFAWQTLRLLDIGPGATCDYQKPSSAREA